MALNDRAVKFAQPADKVQYLIDGDGLYLKITPKGLKTWLWRNQEKKDRKWVAVGRYPAMSLAQARQKLVELRSTGLHALRTVRKAYDDWKAHIQYAYDSHSEIERRFEADVLPKLGDQRLDRVTKADCADALQKIVDRGSRVAANRTLADLKHFFDWCTDRGWIQGSPAAGIKRRSVGGRERSRKRALSFDELALFVRWLLTPRYQGEQLKSRVALALILLTGQRPSEVLGIDAKEMRDLWWYIPPERVGKGAEPQMQKVYLSPQARALLDFAFHSWGSRPLTMNHRVLSKLVSRACERERWLPFTPHDLRRTMSTRLADLGVAPHVVEKMLNHKMEGAMEVYNRAEYLPERRAAWRLWGAKLAAIRREAREKSSPGSSPRRLRGRPPAVLRTE